MAFLSEVNDSKGFAKLAIVPPRVSDVGRIYEIESESFSSPWSLRGIYREFSLLQSINKAAYDEEALIAYSFNRLILDELHIVKLAVAADYRRVGIGRHLMELVIHQAECEGVAKGFLEVRKSNIAAQKLYREMGFENCGIRAGYYRDNFEDALVMQKIF